MVFHLRRILLRVKEHGAVGIQPGNPPLQQIHILKIVHAGKLQTLGGQIDLRLQLALLDVIEVAIKYAHNQHNAGQKHAQRHQQNGAKNAFGHASRASIR